MQTIRPPSYRFRFSPLQPALLSLPMTDDRDIVQGLLSSTNVLPEQFYGPPASLAGGRLEAELMRAVLADAFPCFQKGLVCQGRRVQRSARKAEEWLFSDDARWPFAFVSICTALGLEPEYIQRGLKHWGQSRLPTEPKKRSHMVKGRQRLAA